MAVNINWNALQPRDFGASAVQYAQAGQEARQQQAKQNALSQYATNPDGAVEGLVAAGDIAGANALQKYGVQKAETAARTAAAPMVANGDYQGAAKAVAGLDPKQAAAYLQLDETQRAAAKERAGTLAGAAQSLLTVPYEQRRARLAQMAPGLQQAGITPEQLNGFDPTDDAIGAVVGQTLSVKDQFDRLDKDRTFGAGRQDAADRQSDRIADNERQAAADRAREANADRREGRLLAAVGGNGGGGKPPSGYRWTPEGDLQPIPGGPGDTRQQATTRKTEVDLRKEFDAQPEVKNFRTVDRSYRNMAGAFKAPSAAGDVSGLFSYMKMLDPDSVVREGEYATAKNAGGIPDRVIAAYNNAKDGRLLTAKQRADFLSQAHNLQQTAGNRFATIADNYRGYAQQYGATPNNIVNYERKVTRQGSTPGKAAPSQVMRFDAQGNPVK